MKSMVLTGIRQMEMIDKEIPMLKNEDDILIKLGVVGVCGSDVHYYNNGKIGRQVVKYPFTVGHEGAGIIEEVGQAVSGFKSGDRIAFDPAMPCKECDQCKIGRSHTCRHLRFLGCPGQAEGCLSEYIVLPESCCYKIKDSMSLEQAAITEPLSIGVYAVEQSVNMTGKTVGILGVGPIGLSCLLPSKYYGAKSVYVTDKIDSRIRLAKSLGAKWGGNPEKNDIVKHITDIEPLLLDVVFECCGDQEALDQAIKLLKPGGKLMIVGIPEFDRVSFNIDDLRHKEICIQNVRRQNECIQKAVDLVDNKSIDVMPMITHRFPFNKTKDAFELVADYRENVVKAMIDFNI